MRYRGLVMVEIWDDEAATPAGKSQCWVEFDPPEDPRGTLTRPALEAALESLEVVEKHLWGQHES